MYKQSKYENIISSSIDNYAIICNAHSIEEEEEESGVWAACRGISGGKEGEEKWHLRRQEVGERWEENERRDRGGEVKVVGVEDGGEMNVIQRIVGNSVII